MSERPHDHQHETTGTGLPETCTKHDHGVTFGDILARFPEYTCRTCGKTLRHTKAIRVTIQVLFYLMLAGIIWLVDLFTPLDKRGAMNYVIDLGKALGVFVVYLIARLIIAKVGPVELAPEREVKPVDEEADAEADAIYREQMSAHDQEKQALMEMYKQYETAAQAESGAAEAETAASSADAGVAAASAGADATAGADAATGAVVATGTAAETAGAAGAAGVTATAGPLHKEETGCHKHVLKETWKNYLPGRRVYQCKNCDTQLNLSKKQGNIINGVFFIGFVLLVMRDTMNLSVSWGTLGIKVAILLVIVDIVQAIVIHTVPFREDAE